MAKKESQYYHDAYGNVHGPEVLTPTCRCLYVNLAEPSEYTPGKPTWGLTLVWDKTDEETTAKWKNLLPMFDLVIADHPKSSKFKNDSFIRDGDEKTKEDGTVRTEFKGKYYVTLSASKPLEVIDRSKNFLDPSKVEGGMFVRSAAKIVASTPSGTYKVSLKPTMIQLVHDDGTRYGKRDAKALFDDLPMDDMLEDPSIKPQEGNMFENF